MILGLQMQRLKFDNYSWWVFSTPTGNESKMYINKRRKATENDNFHFPAQYLTRQLLPPFDTKPLLAEIDNLPGFSSKGWMTSWKLAHRMSIPSNPQRTAKIPRFEPWNGATSSQVWVKEMISDPQADCLLLLTHLLVKEIMSDHQAGVARRPVVLPVSYSTKGSSFPGRFYVWPLSFERWWTLNCSIN